MAQRKVSERIYAAIAYSDIFDFPLPTKESKKRGLKILKKAEFLVEEKEGYLFLKGREKLVPLAKKRKAISETKIKRAKKWLFLLKIIPWVKMIAVTGSVASFNAQDDDDIDILIVTTPKRLWLSRFLASLIFDLLGVRRKRRQKHVKNKLCLNMFLSLEGLEFKQRDIYTAHELVLLKPLFSEEKTYEKLLGENSWIQDYLPSVKIPSIPEVKTFPSGWKILDRAEEKMMKLQARYMGKKAKEVIREERILFHPKDVRNWILKEFQTRLVAARF